MDLVLALVLFVVFSLIVSIHPIVGLGAGLAFVSLYAMWSHNDTEECTRRKHKRVTDSEDVRHIIAAEEGAAVEGTAAVRLSTPEEELNNAIQSRIFEEPSSNIRDLSNRMHAFVEDQYSDVDDKYRRRIV